MSTSIGVLIAAPFVFLLIYLTRRIRTQDQVDAEARAEQYQRLQRLEQDRDARLAAYAAAWARKGYLERRPVIAGPSRPRLVARSGS